MSPVLTLKKWVDSPTDAAAAPFGTGRELSLTWGVSGQAHSLAPAAGVSPVKRGEAQRSRERSDLDAPAAGYTVMSERALARSRRPLLSLPRSFILPFAHLLLPIESEA